MTDGDVDFGVPEFSDCDSEGGVFMMPARVACKVIKGANSCRAFSEGPVIFWALTDLNEQD